MVDAIVVFLLFVMFLSGLSRGTLRQLWSLAVLAISTYLAGHLYRSFTGLTGRFLSGETASNLAAFVLVYVVVSAVLSGPIEILLRINREQWDTGGGGSDRLAGAILGIIEGVGLIEVGAAVILTYPVLGWDGWLKASKLVAAFFSQWPLMMPLLPSEFQKVLEIFR